MILALRTDKPEAELYVLDQSGEVIEQEVWQAHRQLGVTIHSKIRDLLARIEKDLDDIKGIVVYEGPGSFTGLRIGMSVANALAQSLSVPVVASGSDDWLAQGVRPLQSGSVNIKAVTPVYGSSAQITQQRK